MAVQSAYPTTHLGAVTVGSTDSPKIALLGWMCQGLLQPLSAIRGPSCGTAFFSGINEAFLMLLGGTPGHVALSLM